MGFYSRFVFPRLCDFVMRQPRLGRLRRELLSGVGGRVLEIGFGSGLNLPHYPKQVQAIAAVDPNPGMTPLAKERVKHAPVAVDYRILSAERLPFEDGSFDSVVSTWTLCSIPDVDRALEEINRVLAPGGRFFFLEHGRSDEPKIQAWQDRLTPLNKILADGCHLNRDIKKIIDRSGLSVVALKRFYMEDTPKIAGHFFQGVAVRSERARRPAT